MSNSTDDKSVIEQKQKEFKAKKEELQNNLESYVRNNNLENVIGSIDKVTVVKNINNVVSKLRSSIHHYGEIDLLKYIDEVILDVNRLIDIGGNESRIKIIFYFKELSDFVDRFVRVKEDFKTYSLNTLSSTILEVNNELTSFRRLRNIADNAKTEGIYNNAVMKYRDLEKGYRTYFYWAIGLTVTISLATFFAKKLLVPDFLGDIEFWVLKASIIVVGITLITYFLKQSAHYQRLADQNYQTQVELQAYPSFMESIPTEEAASVRKELALKYFGREIDGAAHKDMSNLISDQMKSTTEMVKAATDVLKAKGGSNGS